MMLNREGDDREKEGGEGKKKFSKRGEEKGGRVVCGISPQSSYALALLSIRSCFFRPSAPAKCEHL